LIALIINVHTLGRMFAAEAASCWMLLAAGH